MLRDLENSLQCSGAAAAWPGLSSRVFPQSPHPHDNSTIMEDIKEHSNMKLEEFTEESKINPARISRMTAKCLLEAWAGI